MIQSIKIMQGETTTKDKVKMVLGVICGLAADAAVTAALGSLMPAGGGWKKFLRMGGTFVLAMMAGEQAEAYACKVFDETDQALKDAKKELEDNADIPAEEGSVK